MYVESMGMSVGNMANTATANINTVRQAGTANAAPVKQPAADAGTVKQTGESISSIPAKQTVTSAAEHTVQNQQIQNRRRKISQRSTARIMTNVLRWTKSEQQRTRRFGKQLTQCVHSFLIQK